MRAAADNPFGASLIGISVSRVAGLAFALSGELGALAENLIEAFSKAISSEKKACSSLEGKDS